jgi:hypothetical protein
MHITPPSEAQLRHAWQERCQKSDFSPHVLGVGTIKVFGRAGDAPVMWPRITSLDALPELDPDEQWAVQFAERVIAEHQQKRRPLYSAVAAGQHPEPINGFDPSREYILILSQIVGG